MLRASLRFSRHVPNLRPVPAVLVSHSLNEGLEHNIKVVCRISAKICNTSSYFKGGSQEQWLGIMKYVCLPKTQKLNWQGVHQNGSLQPECFVISAALRRRNHYLKKQTHHDTRHKTVCLGEFTPCSTFFSK